MGTNYYLRTAICKECRRYDTLHLGKHSFGWVFHLQYNNGKFYTTWEQMKKWLKEKIEGGGKIFDEYGEEINLNSFIRLVQKLQRDKKNRSHNNYMKKNFPYNLEYLKDTIMDIDGFEFASYEFS